MSQHYQVSLTGKRAAGRTDAELLDSLMSRFRVDAEKARTLLQGRRVIKRQLDQATAAKLALMLQRMGLEAVVESAAGEPVAAASEGPTAVQKLEELGNQRLPRIRVTPGYVISLASVTLLCVIMPLLYLGLTAATAYACFWYLTHIHNYIDLRNIQLLFLVYGAPGLTGFVLVLFLLKPLLARRPGRYKAVVLDQDKEKDFVAGIHGLCRAIGTAAPKEIHLDWDVNASVHYRSGWFSLITGHKVLTIGLPLMAGMTARQFTGVLAHEFGHFTQRLGMRCGFIINSVNAWLEFRAYGEDSWDQRLREWSDESDNILVSLVILAAQTGMGLTRLLMKLLFQISFRASRHLSRQKEFDADRYGVLVSGSDNFRSIARDVRGLSQALHEVHRANMDAWREGKLLRNLPQAVALQYRDYDAKRLAAIELGMQEEVTRYWDTHPAGMERIEHAERQNCPGVYLDERPAALLMKNFEGACERLTGTFYRDQGISYSQKNLRPVEDILAIRAAKEERFRQLEWYFNGQFRALPFLDPALLRDEKAGALDWQAAIDQLRARSPEIARDWREAYEAELSRPGRILFLRFGDPQKQTVVDRDEYERIRAQKTPQAERLRPAMALYLRRLRCAGETLAGEERRRFVSLLRLLQLLYAEQQAVRDLLELQAFMRELERFVQGGAGPAFERELTDARSRHHDIALGLLASMEKVPQDLGEGGTVAGWLWQRHANLADAKNDILRFQRVANGLPNSLLHFYCMVLEALTVLAGAAEKVHGIRPIKVVLLQPAG
jgi:Zn-dependent protease with chaperone function